MDVQASPYLANAILLFASWINTSFYVFEIAGIYTYLGHSRDETVFRCIVILSFVFDSVDTAGVCAYVFLNLVGSTTEYLSEHWTAQIMILSSCLSAFSAHIFLIYRFWLLSQRSFVTLFLALVTIAHIAMSVSSVICYTYDPSQAMLISMATPLALVGRCLAAAADIFIALSLLLRLRSLPSTFYSTRCLLKWLSFAAISSGAVVASVTLVAVVLFMQGNLLFNLFFLPSGRIYTLTILANLRMRECVYPRCLQPKKMINGSAISIIEHRNSTVIRGGDAPTATPREPVDGAVIATISTFGFGQVSKGNDTSQ